MIRMIVDRCHVSMSYRQVCRYLIGRLKCGYGTYYEMPRQDRLALLVETVQVHKENKELYNQVMQGRF